MAKHQELAGLGSWLDERQERFINISDKIWEFAEIALAETKSCALQAEELEADGFRIQRNVGGLPTAFVAEWGEGAPVIGFLGEYDALPELSQKSQATQDPIIPGGAGHGCGHNLLGTASLAAATALKAWLEGTGQPGTVRYYGCPAEETGAGKVFMARGGAFEGLDAVLTWHPGSHTTVMRGSTLAVDHIKFRFFGQTAHAAGNPHMGRSALDAVELTNIGVNFLREHVIESARIHYVITNGGGQPNVVPAEAEVWYYIRAPRRDLLEPITQRVQKIAEGAAMMTETRLEIHDFFGVHNYLPNTVLAETAMSVLEDLGPIDFTDEERDFARQVMEVFPESSRVGSLEVMGLPKELVKEPLLPDPYQPTDEGKTLSGSTDVSEASWNAPTLQLWATCFANSIPGHSWAVTATGAMSIGHKGMLHAAKAMAITAAELVSDPALLARAKDEFQQAIGDYQYRPAIPEGAVPPQPYIRK
jgi:aminobenzoyl-glutamate utilization protein B